MTIAVTDTAPGKAGSHVPDESSSADLRREPDVFSPACVEEAVHWRPWAVCIVAAHQNVTKWQLETNCGLVLENQFEHSSFKRFLFVCFSFYSWVVINSSQNIDDFFFLTEVFVTSPAKNSYFFVVFKVRNEKCRVWGHERFSNPENYSVKSALPMPF